jgi:putrescine transport system ATP-binding protein
MAEELSGTNIAAEAAGADAFPAAEQGLLRIEGVAKTFGTFRAVDGVSLDIKAGEFFALLGPSGCGKTTLLRMLAGFEAPDEGRILLGGKDIAQALPHERPVNMMFQNYALFPHLSVRDNIAFGLKRAGMARADIATRVAEMVALVKLEGLEKRKPDQLSGGQRQRVAIARAMVMQPSLLLADEPTGNLDSRSGAEVVALLEELNREGLTLLVVTHDPAIAARARRQLLMRDGRIVSDRAQEHG